MRTECIAKIADAERRWEAPEGEAELRELIEGAGGERPRLQRHPRESECLEARFVLEDADNHAAWHRGVATLTPGRDTRRAVSATGPASAER
jgi:hypothetical protein